MLPVGIDRFMTARTYHTGVSLLLEVASCQVRRRPATRASRTNPRDVDVDQAKRSMTRTTAWACVPPGSGVTVTAASDAKLRIWITALANGVSKTTSPTSWEVPVAWPTVLGVPSAAVCGLKSPPGAWAAAAPIHRLHCA